MADNAEFCCECGLFNKEIVKQIYSEHADKFAHHLTDIEAQNSLHVGGQFNQKHVPTEIGAGMSHKNCPEWTGSSESFPRYRR